MTFESIRTTTADKIVGCDIIIKTNMEEYSGWGWLEHLEWISELTGLRQFDLIDLVSLGYLIVTNEEVSLVWLVSRDHFTATAELIYED